MDLLTHQFHSSKGFTPAYQQPIYTQPYGPPTYHNLQPAVSATNTLQALTAATSSLFTPTYGQPTAAAAASTTTFTPTPHATTAATVSSVTGPLSVQSVQGPPSNQGQELHNLSHVSSFFGRLHYPFPGIPAIPATPDEIPSSVPPETPEKDDEDEH